MRALLLPAAARAGNATCSHRTGVHLLFALPEILPCMLVPICWTLIQNGSYKHCEALGCLRAAAVASVHVQKPQQRMEVIIFARRQVT